MDKRNFLGTGVFCTTLLVSVFWGGLAQFDPLGVKSAADLHSESLFQKLISGPWYKSAAQDEITVVLIDDNYLQQINEHWPMSYIQQDLLLSDILSYKPKMVFLDFLYMHEHSPHSEIEQYADTIARNNHSSADNTPLVLIPYLIKNADSYNACADVSSRDSTATMPAVEVFPLTREIDSAIGVKNYIGWSGCGSRYPSIIRGEAQYPTPAFSLFKESCKLTNYAGSSCQDLFKGGASAFKDPMAISWGVGVSAEHGAALRKAGIKCSSFNKGGFFERLGHTRDQVSEIFSLEQMTSSRTSRGISEPCTYTDTVHATWFLGHSEELRDFLRNMIEDRIVLIGTKIEGIHDYISSPVNGQLPGVYLFSMVLDNYFKYGSHYFKEMSDLESFIVEVMSLFAITLFIKYLWLKSGDYFSHTDGSQGLPMTVVKALSAVFIYKILLPILISFLIAFALWKFRYAPMDWIGVSLLSFIANPVSLKECMSNKTLSNPCTFAQKFRNGSSS